MVIMRELDCQNPSTRQFCEMNVLDNNGDSCNTKQYSSKCFSPSKELPLESSVVKLERVDPSFAKESNLGKRTEQEPLHNKKCGSRKNAWGNLSYAELITKAIESSNDKRLTLAQIYDWMVRFVPYFRDKGDRNSSAGWKNSIRHNLSLHSRFKRIQNEGTGKSSWWTLNPDENAKKPARRRVLTLENKSLEKKWRSNSKKKISSNFNLVNKKFHPARAHIFDSDYQRKGELYNNSNFPTENGQNNICVSNQVSCNLDKNDSSSYILENRSSNTREWKIYYENHPEYLCYTPGNMLISNNSDGNVNYDSVEKTMLNLDAFYAMPIMTPNGYNPQYSTRTNDNPVLADLTSVSEASDLLNIAEYNRNLLNVLKDDRRINETNEQCVIPRIINSVSEDLSSCQIKQLLPVKRHCGDSDDYTFGFTELHLSNMMPINSEGTPQNVITLPNGSTLQSLNSSVNCLTPVAFASDFRHSRFSLPNESHHSDQNDNLLRHHYGISAHDFDKSENIVSSVLKNSDNGSFDNLKAFQANQTLKHARA